MTTEVIDRPIASWRPPNIQRRPASATELGFVPVIFANGEDDDLPGLVAMFKNEAVQFGEHVYSPNENMAIEHCVIVISTVQLAVFDHLGNHAVFNPMLPIEAGIIVHCPPPPRRHVNFNFNIVRVGK